MQFNIDPKFSKWAKDRSFAQHSKTEIPTRNANPTRKAGPKNNIGKTTTGAPHKAKSLSTKKSVGRPAGKVRATNHPSLKSKKG